MPSSVLSSGWWSAGRRRAARDAVGDQGPGRHGGAERPAAEGKGRLNGGAVAAVGQVGRHRPGGHARVEQAVGLPVPMGALPIQLHDRSCQPHASGMCGRCQRATPVFTSRAGAGTARPATKGRTHHERSRGPGGGTPQAIRDDPGPRRGGPGDAPRHRARRARAERRRQDHRRTGARHPAAPGLGPRRGGRHRRPAPAATGAATHRTHRSVRLGRRGPDRHPEPGAHRPVARPHAPGTPSSAPPSCSNGSASRRPPGAPPRPTRAACGGASTWPRAWSATPR